ncbi:hypothetical protein OVS_00035 [Mycoplasma ovis str. Michigan]|uniref:Uncharacterized protein n=1 Tax=Mycoplasma ovis str. Michigan TaxID=1415773 RepID=A0ABM5P0V2_9MOLU|nr:hypothetical protein OVS_00035 [Mycoplasma ovis str. Michigan]
MLRVQARIFLKEALSQSESCEVIVQSYQQKKLVFF